MTEDEMVGWHHQLYGYEFEQALGDSEGQGSLVCYCSRGHKELTRLSDGTTTSCAAVTAVSLRTFNYLQKILCSLW